MTEQTVENDLEQNTTDPSYEQTQAEKDVVTIVLTADNHLGYAAFGQHPRKREELQHRLRQAFEQVTAFAIEQGVDLFIQAGDLFDTVTPDERDRSFVAARLAQLQQAGIRTFALGGVRDTPLQTPSLHPAPQISYARSGMLHYFPPVSKGELEPILIDVHGVLVGICGLGGLPLPPRMSPRHPSNDAVASPLSHPANDATASSAIALRQDARLALRSGARSGGLASSDGDPLASVRVQDQITSAALPLLVLHAPIEGLSPPSSLSQVARLSIAHQSTFSYILAGYSHTYSRHRIGQTEVIVAGSTQILDFSAPDSEPGFVFLGLAADGVRWCHHIGVKSLRFRRLVIHTPELWPDISSVSSTAPNASGAMNQGTIHRAPTEVLLERLQPLCDAETMIQLRLEGQLLRRHYAELDLKRIRRFGEEHCFTLAIDDSALSLLPEQDARRDERLFPREELINQADEWIAQASESREKLALQAAKEQLLLALDEQGGGDGILLKHLSVECFRCVRKVDLHFPQRGCILLQGPNGSGKSTLLESIYFALYGESFLSCDSLDDLIQYDASHATVTLSLLIGATGMTITRTIERHSGQRVTLSVQRPGILRSQPLGASGGSPARRESGVGAGNTPLRPAGRQPDAAASLPVGIRSTEGQSGELITQLEAANDRILTELGYIDGQTLCTSFFLEQKGLGRLESLSGVEREAAIRRLLGLEKLTRRASGFTAAPTSWLPIPSANDATASSLRSGARSGVFRPATNWRSSWAAETFAQPIGAEYTQDEVQYQARLPERSLDEDVLETALDAVTGREHVEEEAASQELVLQQLQVRLSELKGALGRVQQLKQADATLGDIIAAYDAMTEARRSVPELEKQLVELDWREREELPALEKRVNDLVELAQLFSTLQRLSNDLLTSVDTIQELEQDLKQHDGLNDTLKQIGEQIAHAQFRVAQVQQRLHAVSVGVPQTPRQRRTSRPVLQVRLLRLKTLQERLAVLGELEQQHMRRLTSLELTEENFVLRPPYSDRQRTGVLAGLPKLSLSRSERSIPSANDAAASSFAQALGAEAQLNKIQQELDEAEQELALVENETKQAQQQAEALEKRWRQLSIRKHLEEWLRLKSPSHGFAGAEQHMRMAHQHQEQLTSAALEARRSVTKYMRLVAFCGVLFFLSAGAALLEAIQRKPSSAAFAGVAIVLLAAGAGWGLQYYRKACARERVADRQLQDAMSRGRMTLAQRLAASGMGKNTEGAINQAQTSGTINQAPTIEDEIRSLGGKVPSSVEEAQLLVAQIEDTGGSADNLTDIQKQLQEKRDVANAAHHQLNDMMEAVALLRKERARLEELCLREKWENIQENLGSSQAAIERMHQEITLLAAEVGLPLPSITARLQSSLAGTDTMNWAPTISSLPFPPEDEELADVPELDALVEGTIKASEREIAALDGKQDMVADVGAQFIAPLKAYQDELDELLTRQRQIQELHTKYETNSPRERLSWAREQQTGLRNALHSLQDSLRQRVKLLGVAFSQTAIASAEAAARSRREELHILLAGKMRLQEQHTASLTRLKESQKLLAERYKQLAKFSHSLGSWIVPPNPFPDALWALRLRCQNELQEADEANILRELDRLQAQERTCKAKQELAMSRLDTIRSLRTGGRTLDVEQADTHLQQQELSSPRPWATARRDSVVGSRNTELSPQTRKWGSQLVKAVDERLMRKMIPRTEYYMQQLWPLLTGGSDPSGPYHDVHLTNEPGEGTSGDGPLQLRVWDTIAGKYVAKSEGAIHRAPDDGAAHQLSLALRLAFAIAVLPRELNAAPGFLLLDEPLISLNRDRARALVDVFDILGQHFEQIMLISHSSAFDPTMFPYYVYMDNGLILESNLPVVNPTPPVEIDDEEEDLTGRVAAVSLPMPLGEM